MGLLEAIFGKKVDYKALVEQGAIIVDVRTKPEFQSGHIAKSINVPLDQVKKRAVELKRKNKPLILCCASGMRSGSAASILKAEGVECYNGGSWGKVQRNIG